ncbi:MAG: hypothetical protein QM796_14055 [Chthoniobacteraceae bacterium]
MAASSSRFDYNLPDGQRAGEERVLLAGMFTKGKTSVTEPVAEPQPHRAHDELLPRASKGGRPHGFDQWRQTPESRDFTVPGDISSAAFWLVAAAAQPRSHLIIRDVGLNETRTGVLAVLIRMGAQVREVVEEVEDGRSRWRLWKCAGAP